MDRWLARWHGPRWVRGSATVAMVVGALLGGCGDGGIGNLAVTPTRQAMVTPPAVATPRELEPTPRDRVAQMATALATVLVAPTPTGAAWPSEVRLGSPRGNEPTPILHIATTTPVVRPPIGAVATPTRAISPTAVAPTPTTAPTPVAVPAVGGIGARVERGSPAARAGLRGRDVIVQLEAEPVRSAPGLSRALAQKKVGDRVSLVVVRDGARQSVAVTLDELPAGAP